MAFFAGASNVNIFGGSFVNNEVRGNLTVDDHSRHATNLNSHNRSTNNMTNSHNDNSRRNGGSDEEMPSESMPSESMPSTRSAGYQEDRTRLPPQRSQRPQYSPPQVPSTGGTATNLDSFNRENTNFNRVFNDNSQNYYQDGASPDNRRQPYRTSGPDQGGEGLPFTSGPHGSGQFKAPVQNSFQNISLQQMGVGGPPGSHMSVNGANIQQLDQYMGQDFGNWIESTIAQTKSMVAEKLSGGNHDPRAAYSSPSRKVDGSDSMNTGMANLSLNDQIPTQLSQPTSSSSERQVGLKLADQMGSSIPPTSYLNSYNNGLQQGTHYNPSLPPRVNEPDTVDYLPQPTETRPYGNNGNRPPPPASTTPFNLSPSFSGGPNSITQYGNPNKQDHSVHHTNINAYNQHSNTMQDSFNNNSIFDTTGKHSATKSKKKQGFRDPDVPIATKKEQNSGVRTSLDPSSNGVDEEISSDEAIETAAESTVDSSGKKKKGKRWLFGRK